MKEKIINCLIKILIDIFFGLIASIFVYFVIGEIIPDILSTSLKAMNGGFSFSISFDKTILKNIFSIWHNFCILFGIRFIIGYICGNYNFEINKKS